MPQIDETPDSIRPYKFHGVNPKWRKGDKDAVGDCPFCGRAGKFNINLSTGMWRCVVCNEGAENGKDFKGGNNYTFIRLLYEKSYELSGPSDLEELAAEKNVSAEYLHKWGLCKSMSTGDFIIPAFGINGSLNQLYRWLPGESRMRWLLTPTMGHQLFGMQHWDESKPIVFIQEGFWDGVILDEVMSQSKESGQGLKLTGHLPTSIRAQTNIVAVASCQTFPESWLPLLSGKIVVLGFDNDHPREHPKTKQYIPPAGLMGMKRIAEMATSYSKPPKEIRYIRWGEEHDGVNLQLPSGYDVRDALNKNGDQISGRIAALSELRRKIVQVPADWVSRTKNSETSGEYSDDEESPKTVELVPCDNYAELTKAWRKALKWTPGLDHALATMLASVLSTMCVGDQLWIKVIGPPSCGKSTLCEALSANRDYVLPKSTIRGFHSGYGDGGDDQDHSLIKKAKNKTLVTKDGDTLLQSPNLGQVLSEARDIYDKVSRSSYRNKSSRSYTGIQMTWLLCGTSSLRSLDNSELGERFLDCVIMHDIDDELEDEILERVAYRSAHSVTIKADENPESQQDAEMTLAMQLTAGYVQYLRDNDNEILSGIEVPEEAIKRCSKYGKFVAFMRARPGEKQKEKYEREFAPRLVSQHTRYACCLAGVLNKKVVDEEILERTHTIALDTARGITLEMCKHLRINQQEGCDVKPLAIFMNKPEEEVRRLLRFLRAIGAVEVFQRRSKSGGLSAPKWRLSKKFYDLWTFVMGEDDQPIIEEEESHSEAPEVEPEPDTEYQEPDEVPFDESNG